MSFSSLRAVGTPAACVLPWPPVGEQQPFCVFFRETVFESVRRKDNGARPCDWFNEVTVPGTLFALVM